MSVFLIKRLGFIFYLILFVSVYSCKKAEINVDLFNKKSNNSSLNLKISNVEVNNNQVIISGTGFSNVDKLKIKDGANIVELQIVSRNSSTLIATSSSTMTIAADKMLDFVFSNAKASAAMSVNFSLCETTLGGYGFNCNLVPNDKDVLSFDSSTGKWKPRSINGLNYLGAWDASSGVAPIIQPAGSYYVISVAGTLGALNFGIGDWLVSNGTLYQKIDNSSEVSSVFGRTGSVVGAEGDYELNQLADVDLTVVPVAGKVLKFNGTQWVASDDLSGGGVGSVTTTEIAAGAVTDAKISEVAASKITGTINGTQIGANVIMNSHVHTSAGIDYSKLNVPNGAIPYAKLNINAGEIPQDRISGLTGAIGALVEDVILNGEISKAPSQNAVFDALSGKLNTTGGTITPGYLSVATPVVAADAANKGYVDSEMSTGLATKVSKAGDTMTGDLNIDANLKLKGTTNYVTIRSDSSTSTYTITLPSTSGTSGYVLTTNGAGVLSWTNPSTVTQGSGTVDSAAITDGSIVDADINASANISQSKINGLTTALSGKESAVTAGTTAQYYRGDKTWQTLNGGAVANTAAGNIAAVTVQAAINELDTEKQANIETSTALATGSVTTNLQGGLNLNPFNTAAGNTGEIRFYELAANGSNYTSIKAPDSLSANINYVMPSVAPTAGQVLSSSASGVMSWITVSGGGGDAVTTNPLSQFASTTSAQLAGVISDESGTGALLFANSPTLTGVPLAPTAAANTNNTQIATTAFVIGQAALTAPIMNGTQTLGTSLRYAREDHIHPSDNSRSPVAGSTSITTVGTITTGTWNASVLNPTYGGTGQASLTAGSLLIGNGTSAVNFLAPGSNGNILYVTGGAFASGTPNSAGIVDLTSAQTVSGEKTFSSSVRTTKQVSAGTFSGSSDAINWDNGNVQVTSSACSSLSFTNMQDGGSYTLIVTNTGTTGCTFPATINGGTAVTWRGAPTLVSHTRTASSHTVYTIIRAGSVLYTSWTTGF